MIVLRQITQNFIRYREEDIVQFDLRDNQKIEAMAVKLEPDGMIFCTKGVLGDGMRMNPTNTSEGGVGASELRKELNTGILDLFPQDVYEQMLPVWGRDLLRLPTEKEIFGCNKWSKTEPESIRQFTGMDERYNRAVRSRVDDLCWYWLSNIHNPEQFCRVNFFGDINAAYASEISGVRLVFKLKLNYQIPYGTEITWHGMHGHICKDNEIG